MLHPIATLQLLACVEQAFDPELSTFATDASKLAVDVLTPILANVLMYKIQNDFPPGIQNQSEIPTTNVRSLSQPAEGILTHQPSTGTRAQIFAVSLRPIMISFILVCPIFFAIYLASR
jgi:hypothetical protein